MRGQEFAWKNVAVGGGGYVTGLVRHPLDSNLVYARTDVGGAYRWDSGHQLWIPITDWISVTDSNLFGVESLAVDPSDINTVYISCGKNLTGKPKGVFKSTDQGKTWQGPYLVDVATAGNDVLPTGVASPPLRNAGERLVVDPHKGNILYFGSRKDGLWTTSNAGENWTRLTLPAEGTPGYGISFVALDPTSGDAGHPCTRIYIGVFGASSDEPGCGIYRSEDSGLTWQRLHDPESGSVTQPRRGQCSPIDGALWVTHAQGVVRVSSSSNNLLNVTPIQAATSPYNALALDPSNAGKAVVIEGFMRSNNRIYRTEDAGNTWISVGNDHQSSVPWWYDKMWAASPSSALIGGSNPGELWYADWYGVWRTGNFISETFWSNLEAGHEEIHVFSLSCPPSPSTVDLFSSVADVEGFRHENGPDGYPNHSLGTSPGNGPNTDFQSTFGIGYCENSPESLVRASGSQDGTGGVCKSQDNGATWAFCTGWDTRNLPRAIAISASNPDIFVATVSGGKPRISSDGGKTFRTCTEVLESAPANFWSTSQPLAVDRVSSAKFYYYVSGKLYATKGEDLTFELQADSLPSADHVTLRARPGSEGEIWAGFRQYGLWKSTDGGKTFKEMKSPGGASIDVQSFAFGKAPNHANSWLYLLGTLDTQPGVQLSKDGGITWSWISSERKLGCSPTVVEASRQVLGRVYVGTAGRGILQGNGKTPSIPSGLAAAPEAPNIRLSWNTALNATSYVLKRTDSINGELTILASNLVSTEYVDTSILPGVNYRYAISAANDFGVSPDSPSVYASDMASSSLAPPIMASPEITSRRIKLQWSASQNASGYHLKKSSSNDEPLEDLATISGLSYTDTTVENGATYRYQTVAFNEQENSLPSNTVSAIPLMSYTDFKAQYFDPSAPDNVSGPLADPNEDGVSNVLVYAFGGNPWNTDKGIFPVANQNQGLVTFTFSIRTTADLKYAVEYSTDLEHWSESSTTPHSIEYRRLESDLTAVIIREPLSSSAQSFMRVRVDAK